RGMVGAEDLRAHLVELAPAPLLLLFVAEHRADVVELLDPSRAVHVVLGVGAHDRGRGFGSKRDRLPALVREGVHLLADDVGVKPYPAREQLRGLQDRRADLLEAVTREDLPRALLDPMPARHLFGQDVADAGKGGQESGFHFSGGRDALSSARGGGPRPARCKKRVKLAYFLAAEEPFRSQVRELLARARKRLSCGARTLWRRCRAEG